MNVHLQRMLGFVCCGLLAAACTTTAQATPLGGVLAAPQTVLANPAQSSFKTFCNSWMKKLAVREKRNRASVALKPHGGGVYGDYVGYSKKPRKCTIKSTGVASNPYVGKLEYLERTLRVQGASRPAARESSPEVMGEIEVLEIFRYDGSAWIH